MSLHKCGDEDDNHLNTVLKDIQQEFNQITYRETRRSKDNVYVCVCALKHGEDYLKINKNPCLYARAN